MPSSSSELSSSDDEPVAKKPSPKPVKEEKSEKKAEKKRKLKQAEEPKKKKKKPKDSDDSSDDEATGPEPGAYWLNEKRMRRVQVREFKNMPLIDIRELYEGPKGYMPGKKGISLSVQEWKKLCELINVVDKEIQKIT